MPTLKRALCWWCCCWLFACARDGQPETRILPLPARAPDAGARAAAPVAARADASQPPIWSVPELRQHQGLPAGTVVRVRGRVVRLMPCPPCPPPAKCKPCTPALDFAERADSALGDAVYLRFAGFDAPSVDSFRRGEEYVFSGTVQHWVPPSTLPFAYLDYQGQER